jgi:hypothetical protein
VTGRAARLGLGGVVPRPGLSVLGAMRGTSAGSGLVRELDHGSFAGTEWITTMRPSAAVTPASPAPQSAAMAP